MKITITTGEHLNNTFEEQRENKSRIEFCNEILGSHLYPDLFDIYKTHVQEIIDIIHEEIDLTEYGDLHSRIVAENVFLKEKLKRIHKIRDESNRQFLSYLKRIDRNKTPTPEYIAHCRRIMENPDSAKTIIEAHNSGFLFHQYLCENILDTYKKYAASALVPRTSVAAD